MAPRKLLAAAAVVAAALLPGSLAQSKSFNVLDFGARGDGRTDDTKAVRAMMAAAASAGGGSVLFPSGYTFLTGAFNLSSNLVVDIAGTLLATPDSEDGHYVLAPDVPWFGDGLKWQAFIHSWGASNITLRGGGVVDGNGAAWWACGCKGNPAPPAPPTNASGPCGFNGVAYERPKLVHLINGSGLTIRDLRFQNSPMWHLRPSWFDDVYITNVSVTAPPNPTSCNTDGIDPDAVQNALIEDCHVDVGDDDIAVKSGFDWFGYTFGRPSRNITFRRMSIGNGHGVSVGSEMSGGVEDILFEDFVLRGTANGPRVKSQRQRGGLVANVTFRNFTLIDTGSSATVTLYYLTSPPPGNASSTPHFRNITLENIVAVPGTGVKTGTFFDGLPESVIEGVTLRNCDFTGAAQPFSTCNLTLGACEGSVLPACPPCLTQTP